jgi:hypothetical protein
MFGWVVRPRDVADDEQTGHDGDVFWQGLILRATIGISWFACPD